MFVRLSRARRWKAGWLLAFVYLLCVLAPTASFALPGSHAVAPCLTDSNHVPGMVHLNGKSPTQHVHTGGHMYDHSIVHTLSQSRGDYRWVPLALSGKSIPEKAPHMSDGQCCGLMCVTALTATLIDIVSPSAPMALCDVERYRKVTDNAPSRLSRPPIS